MWVYTLPSSEHLFYEAIQSFLVSQFFQAVNQISSATANLRQLIGQEPQAPDATLYRIGFPSRTTSMDPAHSNFPILHRVQGG